jgi:hypothetical protein
MLSQNWLASGQVSVIACGMFRMRKEIPWEGGLSMTREQIDREMQESERMRQEMWQNISNGTRNTMDDVRRRVVEEPWYGRPLDAPYERPTGFSPAPNLTPAQEAGTASEKGTVHQTPLEQDKGPGDIGGGVYGPSGDKGPDGNNMDAFYGRKPGEQTQDIHQSPTEPGKPGQSPSRDEIMQQFYGPAREQGQDLGQGKGQGQGMEP